MTDFMVGDRVSIEGTVELVGSAKARIHLAGGESGAAPTPVAPDTPRSNAEAGPVGVCECGHGRDEHTATGPVSNCRVGADSPRLADECTCLIYRPATPSTEETR